MGVERSHDSESELIAGAAKLRRLFREAQLAVSRALNSQGLTTMAYHVLLSVGSAGAEGMPQARLVDELQCPKTHVSTLVRSLKVRGMLVTVHDPRNRRRVSVQLTPEGRRVLLATMALNRQALVELGCRLQPSEIERLLEVAFRDYLGLPARITLG